MPAFGSGNHAGGSAMTLRPNLHPILHLAARISRPLGLRRRPFWAAAMATAWLWTAAFGAIAAAADAPFGFRDLEVYPASTAGVGLRCVDLDRDGRLDLVFAYNHDTSIRLLLQRDPSAAPPPAAAGADDSGAGSVNRIPFDQRFNVQRIYTEKEIKSLDVGDLDGDGKLDIAYYGDPPELVVLYQGEEWGARKEKIPIQDGVASARALRIADANGDGRADLYLLGKGKQYLFLQRADGTLARPELLYSAARDAVAFQVADLDGNGELDLVTFSPRSPQPVTLRLKRRGSLGPERRFTLPPLHDALAVDLDGDGAAELATIQGNTRRVIVYRWGPLEESRATWHVGERWLAFRPDLDSRNRRLSFGDLNGDGRLDAVVSYGEVAEADVYLGSETGDLSGPYPSPTLSEVCGLALGDFVGGDGVEGGAELLVASAKEKSLGWSRWQEAGRFSIPRTVPLVDEPLALVGLAKPDAWRDAAPSSHLAALLSRSSDAATPYRVSIVALEGESGIKVLAQQAFKAGAHPNGFLPLRLQAGDELDALVSVPFDMPRIYRWTRNAASGAIDASEDLAAGKDFGASQLAKLPPEALSIARFPIGDAAARDDLVVASRSHARALRLGGAGRLEILEQFSTGNAAADLGGAVALEIDGDPDLEVLAFDKAASTLEALDRDERGVYRRRQALPLPGFKFERIDAGDFNGDGHQDLVLVGSDAMAILVRGRENAGFVEAAQFDPAGPELSTEEARRFGAPDLLAVGDLNHDGRRDLVVATEPGYYLNFLPGADHARGGALEAALRFRIFEEKSYMRAGLSQGAREMEAADVDGDGKQDLVVLIHDRILIYPQD
jgi:hypothetical protein